MFFLEHSIFFAAILCYIVTIRNFAGKGWPFRTWFDAILLCSVGTLLLFIWFNLVGIFAPVSWMNYLFIPFIYFIGPSTYIGYFLMIDGDFRFNYRKRLYFVPGYLALAATFVLALVAPEVFARTPAERFAAGATAGAPEYLIVLGFLQNICFYYPMCTSMALLYGYPALKSRMGGSILLGTYYLSGLLALGFAAAWLFGLFGLWISIAMAKAALATFIHIFRRISPELFEEIKVALEKKNASRLEGIDLKELHFELIQIMATEKLYMKEDLTLAALADELDVKPHQLSEFLNKYMGMNFNLFVNQMRIEKAVQLLTETPGANILDIAFECGFKSKTAFNAAFRNIKKTSPSKYIEKRRERVQISTES